MRVAAAALALVALPALAARPLVTEDASILDDKACQLEAWLDSAHAATQGWLVPACNFGGHIEWQVGFARTHAAGESRFSDAYAQAKSARKIGEGPWSVGGVLGVTRRGLDARVRRWDNPYWLAIGTGEFGAITAHANVGWSHDRETGRDVTPWGIAFEHATLPRLILLAEAFSVNRERPFLRAGIRHAAIAERLDLDLSVVARAGGGRSDRLVSVGFLYQTGRFLP
jgi:hypothetical protein